MSSFTGIQPHKYCRRTRSASAVLASLSILCWILLGFMSATASAQSSAEPSETPPAEAAELQPLRLAQAGATSGLDPHLMDTLAGHSVLMNLFEGLVETDALGKVKPGLAHRWRQVDDRRWIFDLREGVRFHDGRPFRAKDVVASLERAKGHSRSQVSSYAAAVDKVVAIDDLTVEIRTRHPTPTLLLNLANVRIVPSDAPDLIEHPVGTGPYRLLDYLPGHGVSLIAFEDYWDGEAAEPRVDFFFISEIEKRVSWLLQDRIDIAQNIKVEWLPKLEEAADIDVRWRRSQEVFYVHLDPSNEPFDDRRVRCAVDLAIDRKALAERVGGDAETAGQMVGANSFGFSPNIEATEVDRSRARQLLTEAGHDDGVTLILYHPLSASDVASMLREHLEEVGIRVVLKGLVWHEFFDLLQHTKLPAYLAGWSESTFDAANVFESLVHSPDPERGFGDMNFTGYSRPAIDRRVERAAREMNPEKRRLVLEEISSEVQEDCAFLPLVWPLEHYGIRHGVEWTPRLDGLLRAFDMRRRSR